MMTSFTTVFPTGCDPYHIYREGLPTFSNFFKSADWANIQDKREWRKHLIYAECEFITFHPWTFKAHLDMADGDSEDILLNLESLKNSKNYGSAVKLLCHLLIYDRETVEREEQRIFAAIQQINGTHWFSEAMIILTKSVDYYNYGEAFRYAAATLSFLEKCGVLILPTQEELSHILQELEMIYERGDSLTNSVYDCCQFLRKYGLDVTPIYQKIQSNFAKQTNKTCIGNMLGRGDWMPGTVLLNEEQNQQMEKHLQCLEQLNAFPDMREQIKVALFHDLKTSSEKIDETALSWLFNGLQSRKQFKELKRSFLCTFHIHLIKLFLILVKIDPNLNLDFRELMKTSESDDEKDEILSTFYSLVGFKQVNNVKEKNIFKYLQYGLRIYDSLGIVPWTWKSVMDSDNEGRVLTIMQIHSFVTCLSTLQKKDVADRLTIFWTYTEQASPYLPLKFCIQLINSLSDEEVHQVWQVFLQQPKRFAALIGTKLEVLHLQYGPLGRTLHNCAQLTDACVRRAKAYDWNPTQFYQEVEEARKRPLTVEEQQNQIEINHFHHVLNRTIVESGPSDEFYRFVKIRRMNEPQEEFESEYKVTQVYRKYQKHQKSQMPMPIQCGILQPLPLYIRRFVPIEITNQAYVYEAPKSYGDYITEGGSIEGLFNACHDIGWSISQGVFPEGIFDHNGENKRKYLPLIDLFRSWGWQAFTFGELTIHNNLGPGRVDRPQKAARHENYRGSGRADYGDLLLANQVVEDLKLLSSGDIGSDGYENLRKDYRRPLIEANALVQPVLEVACILTERLQLAGRLIWDSGLDDWDPVAIKEHTQQLQRAMAEVMSGYTGHPVEVCLNFLVDCGVNWHHLSKAMFLVWDHQRFAEQLKSGKWPFPGLFPDKAGIDMTQYKMAENWDNDNGFGRFEDGKFCFDIGPFNGPRGLPPILYLENIMASVCLSLRRGPSMI